MLSQFFQGQFSNTFKSIAQEPGIIQKIKEVFKRTSILLETKQELIKPIFISLCQDNDDLCNWVIKEQLLNQRFEHVNLTNIQFLGELVKAQKQMPSFLSKIETIRAYLFDQIQMIALGFQEVKSKEQQTNLIKLICIYLKSIKGF